MTRDTLIALLLLAIAAFALAALGATDLGRPSCQDRAGPEACAGR